MTTSLGDLELRDTAAAKGLTSGPRSRVCMCRLHIASRDTSLRSCCEGSDATSSVAFHV